MPSAYCLTHGLRTPNKGINQNMKNLGQIWADKSAPGVTEKFILGHHSRSGFSDFPYFMHPFSVFQPFTKQS